MRRLSHQLWHGLRSGTFRLLLLAGGILLGWGVFAPVGTLVWWFNQTRQGLGLNDAPLNGQTAGDRPLSTAQATKINCYIIYLTGVGDFSANQLTSGEEWLLDRLEEQHPNCVTVRDVFPYSAANQDLSGERLLTPLWKAAEHADGWMENVDILIKIRNLWRFAISADDRYGPIYNRGVAEAIINQMNQAHPVPRSPSQPLTVILMSTSGGVQVALGSVPYLDKWLDAELTVISLGGTFNGENGFAEVEQVYHLSGKRDWVEDIPRFVFPSRWHWTVGSPFNQARQQKRYHAISSGSHTHDGKEGYFGTAIARKPDHQYVEMTLQKVNQLPIW